MRFAKDWGYGGMYMMNLFTYISPLPSCIQLEDHIIRCEVDSLGTTISYQCTTVVFCWGSFKYLKTPNGIERIKFISSGFTNAMCFGKTKEGYPKHPLYLSSKTQLESYI